MPTWKTSMSQITPQYLNSTEEREVLELLVTVGKIAAVKFVRLQCDVSLIQANRIVDNLRESTDHARHSRPRGPFSASTTTVLRGRWIYATIAALLLTGFALQCGAFAYWRSCEAVIEQGNSVQGRVVSVGRSGSPVFQYLWQGETLQWQSPFSEEKKSGNGSYHARDATELFVDEHNPQSPLVNDFAHRWLLVTILGAVGSGLMLPALIIFAVSVTNRKCFR